MKVQFVRARGFPDVTLAAPASWAVPRVGEAVHFTRAHDPDLQPVANHSEAMARAASCHEPTWLVVDVLWTYANGSPEPFLVIRLHPEG